MPIYTYRCENCGVQFERQQSFSDHPLTRCPECNKNQLRKVITPAGIIFKGSGWYATDHKSQSGASKSASAKTSETKESAAPATAAASSDSGSTSASASSSAET
jgi:putative FmdB family regulatory protein